MLHDMLGICDKRLLMLWSFGKHCSLMGGSSLCKCAVFLWLCFFFFFFFFFNLVKACENCWRASLKIRIKKKEIQKGQVYYAEAVWLVKLTAVFLGNGTSHGFFFFLYFYYYYLNSSIVASSCSVINCCFEGYL